MKIVVHFISGVSTQFPITKSKLDELSTQLDKSWHETIISNSKLSISFAYVTHYEIMDEENEKKQDVF